MRKLLVLSAIFVALLLSSAMLFAQTQSKGDTLIIGPLNSQGVPLGALNEAIKNDKDASGNRLHKVYKLQRNAQYILTEVLQLDFPAVIVADKPDANNRPPIIRCGLKEDGSTVDNWWNIYDHATFKNLWMTGVNLDGTGPISWIAQTVNTSGKKIVYEGCIFEYPYTWWATFADWGGHNVYKITNCIFKNIGNPTGAMWNGAIFHHMRIDSAIVRNTTFFNFGCFAVNGGEGTFYTEVDHCSFINCMTHPIESHGHVIRRYTNNLFVNCHAISDDYDEIKRHFDQEVKGLMNYAEIQWDPQKLDSLYGPGKHYGKNYDPNGDGKLTPDEQVWVLKNNNWWYTQPIKDYWAMFPNKIVPNPWMNNYNKAMFENQQGDWEWTVWIYVRDTANVIIDSSQVTLKHKPFKFFREENTMNLDPGIKDMNNVDVLLAKNCINIVKERYGIAVPDADKVKWHGVDDYLAFTWPFDFDLSYTNTTLQTASTTGKPVGSLQWWPGIEYKPAGVGKPVSVADNFELMQNYPNPFNPATTIRYALKRKSQVELKVFSVLGTEVATLVNTFQDAGSYEVTFDASKLASGVYFYQLTAGDQTMTRKMMLVK